MARNDNWTAAAGKAKGESITLVLTGSRYSDKEFPEQLAEGTITRVTPATRSFTMPGALSEGNIRCGARQWRATETNGIASIGDTRVEYRIASADTIARLTDPNRALRGTLDGSMRDLRYTRAKSLDEIGDLVSDLETALVAAKALHTALAEQVAS